MLDHASRVHPQRRPQTCACLAAIALTLACRPAPAPPPAPLTGETAICIGIGYPIPSTVFAASRTVNVYLPADYDSSTARYPVVYLVDGGVTQDFHPVSGIAALAGLSGQFREFIVVGVQTEDRHFELSSHSEIPEDLEHIARNGGSDKFRQHLLEEVKPFVESRFRTSGEDAILGESLAGLFIVDTFLHHPESFDHYIAVSPSLWWRNMSLSQEADALLAHGERFANKSFYLTVANEGGTMQEAVERLAGALKSSSPAGLTWWYEPMFSETHATIYHPATINALRLILTRKDRVSATGTNLDVCGRGTEPASADCSDQASALGAR